MAARGAFIIACAALVVAPWTLPQPRARWAHGFPVSTNGGITLLTGNNDSARGGFTPEDPLVKALDARKGLSRDGIRCRGEPPRQGLDQGAPAPQFVKLMPMKLLPPLGAGRRGPVGL